MTDVPSTGPGGRLPRHVWVLIAVVVLVVGFALGGSLRTAFDAARGTPHAGGTAAVPVDGQVLTAALVAATGPVVVQRPAAAAATPAAAPGTRAGGRHIVLSASHRGRALPKGSGTGRRIVYQESTMHLWVVDAYGTVVRDYPVTGRPGWPRPGTYHVFSKALSTASPKYHVTFGYMVRFAHGNELNIGFHDIPRFMGSGRPIQAEAELGAPVGHGGCVRQRSVDAQWLFAWATVGTPVIVLR